MKNSNMKHYIIFISQLFLIFCFLIGFDLLYRWDSMLPYMKTLEIHNTIFFVVSLFFFISCLISLPFWASLALITKVKKRWNIHFVMIGRFLLFLFFAIINFKILNMWSNKILTIYDIGRQGRIASVIFLLILTILYYLAHRKFPDKLFDALDRPRLIAISIFTFSMLIVMAICVNIAIENHIGLKNNFQNYGFIIFVFYCCLNRRKVNQIMDRSLTFVIPAGLIFLVSFVPLCYLLATTEPKSDIVPDVKQDLTILKEDVQNIILVTFDALPANRMSLYGNSRKTTPHLDGLGEISYVFDRAHSEADATLESLTAIHSGMHYYSNRIQDYGSFIANGNVLGYMPNVFEKIGWDTVYMLYPPIRGEQSLFSILPVYNDAPKHFERFYGTKFRLDLARLALKYPLIPGMWVDVIYLEYINKYVRWLFPEPKLPDYVDNSLFPCRNKFNLVKDYLANYRPEHFFLHVHVYPPHQPYHRIHPYKGRFLDDPRNYHELFAELDWTGLPLPEEKQEIADKLGLMYEEYLLAVDAEFGELVNFLKKTDLFDNTMLIVSTDHGHAFQKGDMFHMSRVMYEQTLHIPLIIHMPKQKEGKRIQTLAEHIDIMPTILETLGINQPNWMEGESLWKYMKNETLMSSKVKFSQSFPAVRELISSETQNYQYAFVVYKGNYKLIYRFMGNAMLEKMPVPEAASIFYQKFPEVELFDLSRDPEENIDLSNLEKQTRDELMKLIEQRIERVRMFRQLSMQ